MAREWHAALGLQDCIVVVGGREDIQEYEPIAMSCDTMATSVEILWVRPSPALLPAAGECPGLHSPETLKSERNLKEPIPTKP